MPKSRPPYPAVHAASDATHDMSRVRAELLEQGLDEQNRKPVARLMCQMHISGVIFDVGNGATAQDFFHDNGDDA